MADLRRDARDNDRDDRNDIDDRDLDRNQPDPPERARLVHLDEVKGEFKVAEHDPDIRGWDVRSSDGRTIGKVHDLIVDTGMMKVRYMEVKVDKDALGGDDDRYVVFPIGEARLDDDEDDVYVNIDAAGVTALPPYDPTTFDRAYETSLRDRWATTGDATTTTGMAAGALGAFPDLASGNRVPGAMDEDFYAGRSYDEERFFGKRREGREQEAYLRRSAERRADDLRDERVVDRRPVRDDVRDDEAARAMDRRDIADEPRPRRLDDRL